MDPAAADTLQEPEVTEKPPTDGPPPDPTPDAPGIEGPPDAVTGKLSGRVRVFFIAMASMAAIIWGITGMLYLYAWLFP